MKIGILTQPLHTNYGGLLQAFALQKFLRESGHDVLTVDYAHRKKILAFPYVVARRCVGKFLLGRGGVIFPKPIEKSAGIHTARFVRENIRTTKRIVAPARSRDFAEYGFEAFVVGSDQTWRPAYSPHMPTFFLDFLGDEKSVRRVAYASSFGKDEWEFSPKMTKICAALAKKFHAISVRENSGIALCEKYLGVPAEHLIDPTMLLEQADYAEIVARDGERGFLEKRVPARRVFAYVLDEDPQKSSIVSRVAEKLGATAENIMPGRKSLREESAAFPPVSAWLRGFRDAEFVVTDSFHGSVFSLIFNKPFLAIGNAARGLSRFHSLLEMFGAENRLLLADAAENGAGTGELSENTERKIAEILAENPDWTRINAIRSRERERSRNFLQTHLHA